MDVAVVTVGDELLSGDIENTNATWLARELTDRGVTVTRLLTIPDERGVIGDVVGEYAEIFNAVVVTGGLGQTPDDVTMKGIAAAFDRQLVENDLARIDVERTLEAIADDYPDLSVDVNDESMLPAGSRPLLNGAGLSPGCVVENVYVFPGIPREMKHMFHEIAVEFSGNIGSRVLYTDEPEANLIDRLDEVRSEFDVQIGCYPDREAGHNRLKLKSTETAKLDAAATWLADNVSVYK